MISRSEKERWPDDEITLTRKDGQYWPYRRMMVNGQRLNIIGEESPDLFNALQSLFDNDTGELVAMLEDHQQAHKEWLIKSAHETMRGNNVPQRGKRS